MNTKSVLAFTAVAVAFAMIASPLLTAMDASAYISSQSITQKQYGSQKSTCVFAGSTSCNNIGIQLQGNWGSNFR